jgi:nitrous-oxide reductase
MKRHPYILIAVTVVATLASVHTLGCGATRSARSVAADKVYVAPGELDKYYGFLSGGQSGSVFVIGVPSGRLIREIPVFEPRAAYGYAMHETDPRRQELEATGGLWGDTHHPMLSEKDGVFDGRYLWINDLANGRLARIRLDYFEADRIIKIPNLQGAHGIAVVSPNTKYVVVNGEFEQPTDGLVTNPAPYTSVVAFVDPESMQVKFEVRVNGNIDIADTSKDGRYAFSTVYNLEQGKDMGAMIQYDRDAVAAIDIPAAEKAIAAGRGHVRNGVPILDPADNEGLLTLIPVPKNPHGVNATPDGRYVIASGKLSPTVTIIDAHTLKIVAEPEVGLGPLHTTFDDRGNAFTSLFLDSQVVKWNIDKAVKGASDYIVDRINVHYNIGHLQAVGGDSMHPAGDYLLALNKLSKDHNLNMALPPGYTKTMTFAAGKPGVYWYYCTNFCSALHLEMRGRMVVQPKDSTVTLTDWHAAENVKGQIVPGVPSTGDKQ